MKSLLIEGRAELNWFKKNLRCFDRHFHCINKYLQLFEMISDLQSKEKVGTIVLCCINMINWTSHNEASCRCRLALYYCCYCMNLSAKVPLKEAWTGFKKGWIERMLSLILDLQKKRSHEYEILIGAVQDCSIGFFNFSLSKKCSGLQWYFQPRLHIWSLVLCWKGTTENC